MTYLGNDTVYNTVQRVQLWDQNWLLFTHLRALGPQFKMIAYVHIQNMTWKSSICPPILTVVRSKCHGILLTFNFLQVCLIVGVNTIAAPRNTAFIFFSDRHVKFSNISLICYYAYIQSTMRAVYESNFGLPLLQVNFRK